MQRQRQQLEQGPAPEAVGLAPWSRLSGLRSKYHGLFCALRWRASPVS